MTGWDCGQALLRFYRALDHWDAGALAREVCADAVWVRHGARIAGREAIHAALAGPPRARLVRHVLTNVIVEVEGEEARGSAVMLTYGATRAEGGVAPLHPPGGLFDNRSCFRREEGAWRIAFVESVAVFGAAPGVG